MTICLFMSNYLIIRFVTLSLPKQRVRRVTQWVKVLLQLQLESLWFKPPLGTQPGLGTQLCYKAPIYLPVNFFFFFNWDSVHARLNSHDKAWSYKKKEKIKAYRKSVQKKPTVKRCLLILELKPFRSQSKKSILQADNSRFQLFKCFQLIITMQ